MFPGVNRGYASGVFTANRVGNSGGFSPLQSGGLPVFQDRMMESRGFMTAANANTYVSLNAAGWPTADWQTYLTETQNFGIAPNWAVGTWKCGFYSTSSNAETITASGGTVSNRSYNAGTGLVTFDLAVASGAVALNLKITGTTGGTPSGAYAMLPAYGANQPYNLTGDSTKLFTTEYVSKMSGLAMQRGLDWSNALFNAASMTSSNRNTPSNTKCNKGWNATEQGLTSSADGTDGWPLEWLIALCNQCGSALYWCCPIVADSTYYSAIATLLRDTLQSQLPIYLEIGNEIWNGVGVTNSKTTTAANSYNTANPGVLSFDGDSTQTTLNCRYTAVQCKTVYDSFHSVFGSDTRFKNVFAWQEGGSGLDVRDRVWRFMVNQYGAVTPYIRAVAGAPYMTRDNTSILSDGVNHTNVNDTKANILTQIGLNALYAPYLNGTETQGCQSSWYGALELMNYEDDWEVGSETSAVLNLGAAIMDSGMTGILENNILANFNAGVRWYLNTSFGVVNNNSVLDPQYAMSNDPNTFVSSGSPRYSALTNYPTGYPTPTRNVVSGSGSTVDWINYLDNTSALNATYQYLGEVSSFGIGGPFFNNGGLHGIHIWVTQAGTYSVSTTFTTTAGGATPATGTTGVYLDGQTIATGLSISGGTVTQSLTLSVGDHYLVLGNKGAAAQTAVFPKVSTFT